MLKRVLRSETKRGFKLGPGHPDNKGQVLFLILVFCLMFLSTAILSNMMLTNQTIIESQKYLDFEQAYWAADAGIQEGIKNLKNLATPLNGTFMAASWNADPPSLAGSFIVKKVTENFNSVSLESTGMTPKKLSTRVLTAKVSKRTLRILSLEDRYSP